MPSLETISDYTFSNWGPVTTTFTAPASCSPHSDNIQIGPSASDDGPAYRYGPQCESRGAWECIPTGTVEVTTKPDTDPTQFLKASYYSPGLYCPADWATVGVASRDGSDSMITSGVFAPSATGSSSTGTSRSADTSREAFLSILEAQETAVLCCPSSYSADLSYGCWSTLKDYEPSVGCNWEVPGGLTYHTVTTTVNGKETTKHVQTIEPYSSFIGPSTTTFDNDDKKTMVGMAVAPILTMIHKKSDFDKAGSENHAVKLGPSSSVWSGIGSIIGISVAAMALGAAMILPW